MTPGELMAHRAARQQEKQKIITRKKLAELAHASAELVKRSNKQ